MCRRLDEDGGHLFLKCKEVKAIWRELNLEDVRQDLAEAVLVKEMTVKILNLNHKQQLMSVMLLWIWLGERNKWREEGRRRTAGEVAYLTALLTDRFQAKEAKRLLPDFRQAQSSQAQKWRKPNSGHFKVNTDGAYDSNTGLGGWGFIIRDDQGMMVKSGAGEEAFLQNALHAELLGCAAGLREAARLGLNQVCLEVDASAVKTAIDGEEYRLSALGRIVTEIKHLLFSEFQSWSVIVCPRSCNKTADAIAAYGCKSATGSRVVWDVMPQFIEALVISDLAESDE
jgi:ribonuclease HI